MYTRSLFYVRCTGIVSIISYNILYLLFKKYARPTGIVRVLLRYSLHVPSTRYQCSVLYFTIRYVKILISTIVLYSVT